MQNRSLSLLLLLVLSALACQVTSLLAPQPVPTATPSPPPTAAETVWPSPTPTRQPHGENIELLRLLDASLPGFNGCVDYQVFGSGPFVLDAAVQGDKAYIIYGADGPAGTSWGLMNIIDLSGRIRPEVMGSYRSKLIPTDLKLVGNTAFLTDANCEFGSLACFGFLYIIDISDPLNPATIGSYALDDIYKTSPHLQTWYASSVDVEGDYAYVTGNPSLSPEKSRENALRVVDIRDPTNPQLAGVLESPFEYGMLTALAVDVQDGLAYLASGNHGLWVIDVSDPANLAQVGYLEDIGSITSLMVDGEHAYLATEDTGLLIVDISDPTAPTTVSSFSVSAPIRDIAIENGVAYLAAGEAGVRAVDISDPSNPREIGYFLTSRGVSGVEARDGKIYAADYYTGLFILQLTSPQSGPGSGPGSGSQLARVAAQATAPLLPLTALQLPLTAPLVQPANLVYLGAFRIPQGDSQGCNWSTGEHCFTYAGVFGYNPQGNSLFFSGHPWVGGVGEVSIPDTISLDETAAVLQDIADLADGEQVDPGESNGQGPSAGLVHHERLVISGSTYYDADYTQVNTHGVSGFDFSIPDDFLGWYRFDPALPANPRSIGGYMAPIPAEWQALLGGPALTGNCCLSIISNSSAGPAATAFDPDDVGTRDPIPGETLLFYPLSDPLAPVDTQNTLFNLATRMGGIAFPAGTRSVLFFGRQGTGPYCYGTGEECDDPADSSKGTHAYPYRHQVWAYDANDLLKVRSGEYQPWQVQPYAVWGLDEMNSDGSAGITGAVFDPASLRVYVTENYGDEPTVHVYQINIPTAGGAVYLPLVVH